MVALVISERARRAIAQGVARGDSTTDLEFLGLPIRIINVLERSPYHITTLKQLVSVSRNELANIGQINEQALQQILVCLSKYHELEENKRQRETRLQHDVAVLKKKMKLT